MYIDYPYHEKASFKKIWMIIWFGWIRGMILIIDCTAKPAEFGGREAYRRIDRFTNETTASVLAKGYKTGKGWHDNLLWAFVPVFVKLNGFKKFDVSVKDKNGHFIYSQDTAGTLNDSMVSDNDTKFIKGMGKAALPSMDLQTMIMIIIIGAGAIFGLHMLGLF